jgi:hypothetical protein
MRSSEGPPTEKSDHTFTYSNSNKLLPLYGDLIIHAGGLFTNNGYLILKGDLLNFN